MTGPHGWRRGDGRMDGPHEPAAHAVSPERGSGPGPPDPPKTTTAGATPSTAVPPGRACHPGRALPAVRQTGPTRHARTSPRTSPKPTVGTVGRPIPGFRDPPGAAARPRLLATRV